MGLRGPRPGARAAARTRAHELGQELAGVDGERARRRRRDGVPPPPVASPRHLAGVTYTQRWIRCGKRGCDLWHGPYWYAYWRSDGRFLHSYVGKELPAEVAASTT